MADPLEEIAFLTRSENRIEVLRTLADGAYTRRELGDAVAASQPTIGRVLNDLRDREWVSSDGERYRATATGELVADGITDLRARLETETRLREVVAYLPTDAIDVDLRAFADATITTPTGTRPNAPIERMVDLLAGAAHARLLSHSFNRQKLDCLYDRAVGGPLTIEGVFARDAIAAVRDDPVLQERLRAVVAADGVEIRVTDDPVPVAVEVTDDRTHLLLRDDDGVVRASMDTDDDAVLVWAVETHEHFFADADPLTAADFA